MLKNLFELTQYSLKTSKKTILGWCVAIFSIVFLYMILFSSVQEMAQIKMEAMPEELMRFMGMQSISDMDNFVSYFAMIFNIILIVISIFAVTFGSNLIAKEEKNKTIEFLYSLQVSKIEIYLSKFLTAYIALMAVIVSAAVSTIICGYANGGETFILMDIITVIKFSSISAFIYLSIGTMIAGVSAKISGATVGSIVVVLSYVLGFLSTIVTDSLSWLEYFSPLQIFSANSALAVDSNYMINLIIYALLMCVFVAIGAFVYKKRDYKI